MARAMIEAVLLRRPMITEFDRYVSLFVLIRCTIRRSCIKTTLRIDDMKVTKVMIFKTSSHFGSFSCEGPQSGLGFQIISNCEKIANMVKAIDMWDQTCANRSEIRDKIGEKMKERLLNGTLPR